jgi:hypothetical protein
MRAAGAVAVATYAALCALGWSWERFTPAVRALFYLCLLCAATAAGLIAWRAARRASDRDVRVLAWVAVLCGIAAAATPPLVVEDFWYSLAVGRFAVYGGNVYQEFVPGWISRDLPYVEYDNFTLPYGPVWLWIVHAVSRLGRWQYWQEFALLKGALFAAWVGVLALVATAPTTAARRARAVIAVGWLPIGVWQALVEGHNDVVMMLGVTLWLTRPAHSWALAASVLVKYVSVPLLATSAVDAWRAGGRARWIFGLGLATVLAVLTVYWQGGALVQALRLNAAWRQLTMSAALVYGMERLSAPGWIAAVAIGVWRGALIALVVVYGWLYLKGRASRLAMVSCLWIALLFGADFVPAWYGLWLVPSLMLADDRRLTLLALPWLILVPFVQLRAIVDGPISPGLTALALWSGVGAAWIGSLVSAKPLDLSNGVPVR